MKSKKNIFLRKNSCFFAYFMIECKQKRNIDEGKRKETYELHTKNKRTSENFRWNYHI